MYEVLLLGFGHVLIIAAVAAESFVRDILSSGFFSYSFYVIWTLWYWPLGMILIDKGLHKQETKKRELFRQYKPVTFVPPGSHEWVVNLE